LPRKNLIGDAVYAALPLFDFPTPYEAAKYSRDQKQNDKFI